MSPEQFLSSNVNYYHKTQQAASIIFRNLSTTNSHSFFNLILAMVFFKSVTSPSGACQLVVLNDKHQPLEKGTYLPVEEPLIGAYARSWSRFDNDLRVEDWSQTVSLDKSPESWILKSAHHSRSEGAVDHLPSLGRRMVMGTATAWNGPPEFSGEFHYIKGYWEWTEDVLSRCRQNLKEAYIYDAVRSKSFDGLSKEAHDLQLTKAKDALQAIREEHATGVAQMDASKEKLQKLRDRISNLKRKRAEQRTSIRNVQARLLDAENQVFNITNTPVVDGTLKEDLKKSKSDLKAALEELKNF